MLQEISYEQFIQWMHFFEIEIPEELKADYRAASIRHAIYDLFRDRKVQPEPTPVDNYRLKWDPDAEPKPPRKTWQQMLQIAVGIAKAANAGLKRRG